MLKLISNTVQFFSSPKPPPRPLYPLGIDDMADESEAALFAQCRFAINQTTPFVGADVPEVWKHVFAE
jgi:hypothetical protein